MLKCRVNEVVHVQRQNSFKRNQGFDVIALLHQKRAQSVFFRHPDGICDLFPFR